jgi:hypothetical protein
MLLAYFSTVLIKASESSVSSTKSIQPNRAINMPSFFLLAVIENAGDASLKFSVLVGVPHGQVTVVKGRILSFDRVASSSL